MNFCLLFSGFYSHFLFGWPAVPTVPPNRCFVHYVLRAHSGSVRAQSLTYRTREKTKKRHLSVCQRFNVQTPWAAGESERLRQIAAFFVGDYLSIACTPVWSASAKTLPCAAYVVPEFELERHSVRSWTGEAATSGWTAAPERTSNRELNSAGLLPFNFYESHIDRRREPNLTIKSAPFLCLSRTAETAGLSRSLGAYPYPVHVRLVRLVYTAISRPALPASLSILCL